MEGAEILAGSVGYEMKRVQSLIRTRMDEVLREFGLTVPQYAAMIFLKGSPGISGAELARRSFVTAQTMNQILANLEKRNLIEKHPHPTHGRILQAHPTEEGEALVAKAHRKVEKIEERMLERLDEEKRERLLETLRVCADSLAPEER